MTIDVVVPTIGRTTLRTLFASIARAAPDFEGRIIVVDDRPRRAHVLDFGDLDSAIAERVVVVESGGRGPAAARNAGWRRSEAQWIAFLDDDVIVTADWYRDLRSDLAACVERCAGSQGNVTVPLDPRRKPTDWERNVAALETSAWITADMAYRRPVLNELGGFDERFRRAYREDADFALRVRRAGYELVKGRRRTIHPVRAADPWISVRLQAGNADDVLMDALHGRDWRRNAQAPQGAWPEHAKTAAAAVVATVAAASWAALTARFAWRRIAPGPRTPLETAAMLATSVVIPFAACYHRLRGYAALSRWRSTDANG
jgi:glycosyltransferase involved in cell wall biosynthesis